MILLDTHIWVWWVGGDPALSAASRQTIQENETGGLGVSIISCWEVALKASHGQLELDRDVIDWLQHALAYPGIRLLDLTLGIVQETVRLPGAFHKDPADRFLVSTARVLNIPFLTADARIRNYDHVRLA